MKFIIKLISVFVAVYVLLGLFLAAYFSFAGQHKELLESNLSAIFKRPVSIREVRTSWHGFSPNIQITDFKVGGDVDGQSAFAFDSLSAEISLVSILKFWPKFNDIAIRRPQVEIVTLEVNKLQIAGIPLKSGSSNGISPRRLISWFLNHDNVAWFDGEVVWRRLNGDIQRYSDISFVYQHEQQRRTISATGLTPKGSIAFKVKSNGDIFEDDNWDGSFEVLGNQGQSLLSPDDLSFVVTNGKGQIALKTLQIQRIRDFLRLTGMGGSSVNWLLNSQLSGRLHDVQFGFSGSMLEFKDWSLTARASNVAFQSVGSAPAMDNLGGKLVASAKGGQFEFSTEETVFFWPRLFDESFDINQASGQFSWDIVGNDEIKFHLKNGFFKDQTTVINNLNARFELQMESNRVSSLGQLFKVESVSDLRYQNGEVVDQDGSREQNTQPLFLDASAEFEVTSLAGIRRYFPDDPRIKKFETWWKNAMISGHVLDGKISYQGDVSKTAIYTGKAQLVGEARFFDVELDYGYERAWPKIFKSQGLIKLDNADLIIEPEQAWLDDDPVVASNIVLNSVFRLDRTLSLTASMTTSLPKVMNFLFDGPLLKKINKKRELPITSDRGSVEVGVSVMIPFRKISDATVKGKARVIDGQLLLPEGVPITNINGDVDFTERSAESQNIRARFLEGDVSGQLMTTEAVQPPKMKLMLNGSAQINLLKPWLGEHLLSLMTGQTEWQGDVSIDGPKAIIIARSTLKGVSINAPAPLNKKSDQQMPLLFSMQVGDETVRQRMSFKLGDKLEANFEGDLSKKNHLFDRSMISLGGDKFKVKDGVNFYIQDDQINLDDWLDTIIDLALLETQGNDTLFLDSMRSVKVQASDPFLLGCRFGEFNLSAVSVDGGHWIGTVNGAHINGTLQADPRAAISSYRFDLATLHLPEDPPIKPELAPIDRTLLPKNYPVIELNVGSFRLGGKHFGELVMLGEPVGDAWNVSKFNLTHQGVSTVGSGQWVNNVVDGTISSFHLETKIDEAEGVLQEIDMGGFVRKGKGKLTTNINWIGAPHEFDYSRLNGDFNLRVKDGELVKIEPGAGKLLGLLNFNAIARRLTLDFRDIFATGLQFNRMRYSGVFADGEAIMSNAYILTPAVFVRMEGKLDLDKETIDMEIHVSPDLGGNLVLLSTLANPAAGAVIYLTQQIFKDEMRSASFQSYRALGTWKDFEMVEFDPNKE